MPTVLIVAASPLDQDRLRLSAEVRDIRQALQRSRNRESWTIESNEAATVDDLRRALLDFKPAIVHFSGHGGGASGLCFETTDGATNDAMAEPLARLFHHFKAELKCVVLNACYSSKQADVIRNEIDYVIGMKSTVGDEPATKFAVAFYDAIFAGTDFRTGFDLGCTALDLNNLPDSDVPIFMTAPHLDGGAKLEYSARIPDIEQLLHAYFNTPFRERAHLTTSGEKIQETMNRFYGEQMRHDIDSVNVLDVTKINEEQWRVSSFIHAGKDRQMTTTYVKITGRTVLIEWEASAGYWDVPPKTFLALGSDTPVVARVRATLDSYYNFEYSDAANRFQSVSLRTHSGPSLHGYVRRHSPEYAQIVDEILSDGNSHSITLKIANTGKPKTCRILGLLAPTWIYSEPQSDE